MINGRENSKDELVKQAYMTSQIQHVVSKVVMELLETKPEDPMP